MCPIFGLNNETIIRPNENTIIIIGNIIGSFEINK
jgi:hypothetical protein